MFTDNDSLVWLVVQPWTYISWCRRQERRFSIEDLDIKCSTNDEFVSLCWC